MDSKTNTTNTEALPLTPEPWGSGLGPVRAFLLKIFDISFRPARFFSRMPPFGSITGPLAFALAVSWIGKACEYLWQTALTDRLSSVLDPAWRLMGDLSDVDQPGNSEVMFRTRDEISHWMWGTGSVILQPFLTLGAILFVSFFVYLGSRILVTPAREGSPAGRPTEIRFETALRIVCFGKAPLILMAVPFAGPVLSTLLSMIATVTGAREVYRIGWGRAMAVAFFPQLLLFGIAIMGFFALILAAVKLFTMFL